jgi:hypothetical protein
LIAQDENGNVIGDWYQTTGLNQSSDTIETNGLLVVNQKNQGGAMPINLTAWHLLQVEANHKNADLEWPFHNSNQESLNELLEQYRKTKDESLQPKIRDMRRQQERWQAMYGPGGKLAVGKDGAKHLKSQDEKPYDDLESIEEITLERIDDDSGLTHPHMVSYRAVDEPVAKETLRLRHLAELQALLQPKKREMVQ